MWCWWCCHDFEGTSLHLPYKHDDLRDRFETMGEFCSWGCMQAFNLDRNGCNRGGIIAMNILLMKKKMCGGKYEPFRAAPTRFALKEFGGPLSIEEFRKSGEPPGIIINMPDQIKRHQEIVTRVKYEPKAQTDRNMSEKFQEISTTMTTTETLKLKRTKPLKRDENNLEKSLGITRKSDKV